MRVRCTDAEYDLIKQEAAALGITISTFGRWCAIRVAEALQEHRQQSRTTIEAENNDDGDLN